MPYRAFSRVTPHAAPPPADPRRVVLIRPCCIGDVVMATAALTALRRRYPHAHITWAVGGWSRQAVANHPDVNTVLDTGGAANPAGLRFVRQLRAGRYDLAVSLVRSPLMSAAALASGIPYRAGLDSAGRGFGYNIRVPVDPHARQHEAEIYLQVIQKLGGDTSGVVPNVPVAEVDAAYARELVAGRGAYLVVNPSGGKNPGAQMDAKRYPPALLARLVNLLAPEFVVIVAGPGDDALAAALAAGLDAPHAAYVGALTFGQVGALARGAALYIGNDTGLTHYAAAAGARTAMLLGPTDPARYAPYSPDAIALWRPVDLAAGGFAAGAPVDWDWARDGISPEDAAAEIKKKL